MSSCRTAKLSTELSSMEPHLLENTHHKVNTSLGLQVMDHQVQGQRGQCLHTWSDGRPEAGDRERSQTVSSSWVNGLFHGNPWPEPAPDRQMDKHTHTHQLRCQRGQIQTANLLLTVRNLQGVSLLVSNFQEWCGVWILTAIWPITAPH